MTDPADPGFIAEPAPAAPLALATLGVRGAERRSAERDHSPPMHLTSSFVFDSAADAAATFSGAREGNIYSRFTNPTVQAFERRLAMLEGADACVATASGMAAILSLCLTILKTGDHIIASRAMFGSTISLFNQVMSRFGVATDYVDPGDLSAWQAALRPNTRLLFAETPSNPLMEVVDLAALAQIAASANAFLAVDNTYLSPIFQRPLAFGAHFVVQSATKFIDGQGRCLGGAVLGDAQRVGKDLFGFMRTAGPSMSPFNAWTFLKGLETLDLRMRAQSLAAAEIAQWLCAQASVTAVHYTGLMQHPQHALAMRQQSGHGAVLSFQIEGGRERAFALIDRLELFSITANLGDTRSTVTHPATTTHGRISAEARALAGIGEGLVRLGIGLEAVDDLIDDLVHGLQA